MSNEKLDRTERIKDWTVEQAEYFLAQEEAHLASGMDTERAEELAYQETERRFGLPPAKPPMVIKDYREDVRCWLDENGEPSFSILRVLRRHSLAGMRWGEVLHLGAADFALNVLYLFLEADLAEKYYQAFKWDIIATLPPEGGVISNERIRNWIQGHVLELYE